MEFQHPELRKYNENLSRLIATSVIIHQGESDSIFRLMAMVDRFMIVEWELGGTFPPRLGDCNWNPISSELSEVIQHILAPQQREYLRLWFNEEAEMHPQSNAFRDWLESRIGESLKA